MLKEDYLTCINFIRLKRKLKAEGFTPRTLSEAMNKRISYSTIQNSINGNFIMKTSSLVCLAAYFRCSVDLLVRFGGYEYEDNLTPLKDRIAAFVPRDPDPDWHISYQPLYDMFKDKYGDNYKKEMNLFFDTVENMEMSEKHKEQVGTLADKHRKRIEDLKANGTFTGTGHPGAYSKGLSSKHRTCIHNDLDLPLPVIYNICKALKCYPGDVVTYR